MSKWADFIPRIKARAEHQHHQRMEADAIANHIMNSRVPLIVKASDLQKIDDVITAIASICKEKEKTVIDWSKMERNGDINYSNVEFTTSDAHLVKWTLSSSTSTLFRNILFPALMHQATTRQCGIVVFVQVPARAASGETKKMNLVELAKAYDERGNGIEDGFMCLDAVCNASWCKKINI
jgi:hypothetical protein